MSTIQIQTRQRRQIINITAAVREAVEKARCDEGLLLVTVLHTTCGLLINDANSGWEEDMMEFLERIVPNMPFRHLHDGPKHASSHILGALVGPTLTIGISAGQPVLGTWQSVFLLEFEGPRPRQISLQVLPAATAAKTSPR